MASTLDLASEALAQAAGLVDSVADDARAAAQLLAVLGWAPPPGAAPLVFGRLDLAGLLAALDGLTEARSQGADAAEQALAAGRVAVALAGCSTPSTPPRAVSRPRRTTWRRRTSSTSSCRVSAA